MILAVGAVGTSLWALFTYRSAKRFEAARWIEGLFREFYLDPRFRMLKQVIQYDFEAQLAPLLERRLTNRDILTRGDERKVLEDVDILLNYFEQLLYLEENGQVKRQDREAFFDYWFELMKGDQHGSLRRYSAVWNYEKIAKELGVPRHEYVAVYGSLMFGLGLPEAPDVQDDLEGPSPCRIRGQLFDTGLGYPALLPGAGVVHGELYRVRPLLPDRPAQDLFRKLDEYERYDAADLARSLYVRRVVQLEDPPVDAWVYVYNQDHTNAVLVESGNWRDYRANQSTGD
jgi:gamma-glutamylcyclotransferase (GGCT)/AIG2-like uncharacterized protein YtfP